MTNSAMGQKCRMCDQGYLTELLNTEEIPRCSDFHEKPASNPKLIEISICQCAKCGLIQLGEPVPEEELYPPFEWITNNEPDTHAKAVVDTALGLVEGSGKSLSLTKFDENYHLELRKQIGRERTTLVDVEKDLELSHTNPNQAMLLEKLTREHVLELRTRYGESEIVIASRLVEHASNPGALIHLLMTLVSENGVLVLEVPDSSKPLCQGDLAMIWEEHNSYFTTESLENGIHHLGYSVIASLRVAFDQEDALAVFVAKKQERSVNCSTLRDFKLGRHFSKAKNFLVQEIRTSIRTWHENGKKVVMFGAGHRAVFFINFLRLADYIACVIDDAAEKQGLFLPGSGIEIVSSHSTTARCADIVLFAISLKAEPKVANRLTGGEGSTVRVFSISPDSKYALPHFRAFVDTQKP